MLGLSGELTRRYATNAVADNLLILGGGPLDTFERVRPVFEQFAEQENMVHFEKLGLGQVAKMANNTLLWVNLIANYEILVLARVYGLNLTQLRNSLMRSNGDNWPLKEWDWIYGKWTHKYMAITMGMAAEKEVTLPDCWVDPPIGAGIDRDELDALR